VSRGAAIAAALGVILGAAYMLSLVQRIFYGSENALTSSKPTNDLRIGQLTVLVPLVVLMLVMGLAPSLWLNSIQSGVHPPPRVAAPVMQKPIANAPSTRAEVQR
jgi:NADH-quinone oxidoreductase subunit M